MQPEANKVLHPRQIFLECLSCSNRYNFSESTATEQNRSLYCSDDCEGFETERLAEGNKIVQGAAENPNLELMNVMRQGSNSVSVANVAPNGAQRGVIPSLDNTKSITDVVDGFFNRLNISNSKRNED